MKQCVHCGHEMEEDAIFCENCGQDQNIEVTPEKSVSQEIPNEDTTSQEVPPENKTSIMENETVQQTISAGKNYLSYFLEKLKKPTLVIEQATTYFGYVTLLLFTFFQTLIIFAEIKRAGILFGSMLGMVSPGLSSTFEVGFGDYLKIFISFLLFVVVSVGITYLVIHFIFKAPVKIHDIVNKFASVFSAITVVSLVVAFCTLINLTSMTVSIFTLLAGFFVSVIAIILLVTEEENEVIRKWTPFYSVSLTLVIIAIIDILIMNILQ